MRRTLAVCALLLVFAAGAMAQTVTTRLHFRELEVPLLEVLDAIGLTAERDNLPAFRIEGNKLVIIVQGDGR